MSPKGDPGRAVINGGYEKTAVMKRKVQQQKPEPIVPAALLEQAKRSISSDRPAGAKCSVCGADTTSVASERLCWVCRRLKISAWRDSDVQMPAQE